MRQLFLSLLCVLASHAQACERAVCLADPETLPLAKVITFDDQPSGMGPGIEHTKVLVLDGASFGEYFNGQSRSANGDFDRVSGQALPPLTLMPRPRGELFSIHRLGSSNVINGFGPARFPKREAQGEGALAILFHEDQAALSFDVLGGEKGVAQVIFLRRDGSVLDMLSITPLSDRSFGFYHTKLMAEIAGIVITNEDPEGIALDNLRFGAVPQLG